MTHNDDKKISIKMDNHNRNECESLVYLNLLLTYDL